MTSTVETLPRMPAPPDADRLFTQARRIEAGRIVLVAVLTLLYSQELVPWPWLVGTLLIGLYPLARTGLVDLVTARRIGTELFVTMATAVAFLGGEYVAAAVLMTIILIAEFIADLNTDRARASIKSLIGAAPRVAVVKTTEGERAVPIERVSAGDVVVVRAGDRIPVDGTVVTGQAAVDEASITGESVAVDRGPGGSVLAGTLVTTGALDIHVDKVGADTLFARIVALVETADADVAPVQRLTDRVASWLLPVVLVFLVTVFLVTHDIRKVVTLLIFTSPAELGLATPMVMLSAIARAARYGILIKGGLYLEQLAKATAMVFDKTGTLTLGQPAVVALIVHDPAFTEDEVLRAAAIADVRSGHPLAAAVVAAARGRGLDVPDPDAFDSVHGRGVVASVEGRAVMVGNDALLEEHGIRPAEAPPAHAGTAVRVAIGGKLVGSLHFADRARPGTADVLAALRRSGVKRIVMLTGDNLEAGRAVAGELGIDDVRANLLPEDKVRSIEELRQAGYVVAMVGDGVNDAPALARADVGIAMGARGTQAAIEAADIALMTDDLSRIVTARVLARRAYRTIQENLIVGVGVVHVLGIVAALQGWIGPVEAALLHLGPDILVFLNSVKLLYVHLD